MKRTPLKRKTALRSSGGLKSGGGLKRSPMKSGGYTTTKRKPIKQQSAKKKRENDERREVLKRLVEERGEMCEAQIVDVDRVVCTGVAVDGHEVLTRARGGSATDPENILLVCRECHEWIGANPAHAKALGLLKSSWDDARETEDE